MNELLVGYARVSTEQQDLTSQRNGLHALGVGDDRIYVDHGLTGTNRDRPGLRLALAACRAGDTLVVTKLDRLARSLRDARDILDELTRRNVRLSLGGSIHDPTDPVGRHLFNVLSMVAEFESIDVAARRPHQPHCGGAGHGSQPLGGRQAAVTVLSRRIGVRDTRPRDAIDVGLAWVRGEVRMGDARRAAFAAITTDHSSAPASRPASGRSCAAAGRACG